MKKVLFALTIAAIYALSGSSCKKSDGGTTNTDSGQVYIHLHTNIDTNEADYGSVYADANGRKISLTRAQLYISDIRLTKTDNTIYHVPNKIVLKTEEVESYFLATVPAGDYKSITFNVGLDPTTNASAATADSALNHPEMWFGSTAQPGGYIFLNMEGTVDTTGAANGSVAQMQPFMYHLGTSTHLNTVIMPDHTPVYSVTKNQIQYVHITIDYSKLFTGVQLNTPANLMIMSTNDNTSAVSNTVSGNVSSMFRYEE